MQRGSLFADSMDAASFRLVNELFEYEPNLKYRNASQSQLSFDDTEVFSSPMGRGGSPDHGTDPIVDENADTRGTIRVERFTVTDKYEQETVFSHHAILT
ncbi:hypothetical protein CIG75_14185 [Tumebacillus algifaecis]|uniref:Uncharacterized protein n=1 Tax=Tumebacillus algifaecis TaxID=1214604 RepID=A0A223D2U7_9BACL|nr:hypothetical protein [Tumebacillus algifaecis]ASS75998.1 hypothetical protein CIG75_14185 [Tumebacillus algifaecis]